MFCVAYIKPFIDLNGKGGRPPVYKDDFTVGDDGIPVCKEGFRMRLDGTEPSKSRRSSNVPRSVLQMSTPTAPALTPAQMQSMGALSTLF